MDNDLHEPISEISEIPDLVREPGYYHFAAAVGWGTSAGMLAIILPLAVSDPSNAAATIAGGIFFVGLFAIAFSLTGLIVIGLPVTALLMAARAEHRQVYAAIGAIAGVGVMVGIFGLPQGSEPEFQALLLASGGLAGFASALRWGRWREALARYRQQLADQEAQPNKRSNPIHDLIH